MTSDEVLDVIRRWQEAFERRDLDAHTALYAETAVLESPMVGSARGRAAVRAVIAKQWAAFPDSVFTLEPPVVDGDRAAIVAAVSGHHNGEFMGLPPTGKAFQLSLVFLMTFRGGHIEQERRIYDFTGFLVQLGVLTARPA
jgi:steroid delta-isomerase-like uncharacterized protein